MPRVSKLPRPEEDPVAFENAFRRQLKIIDDKKNEADRLKRCKENGVSNIAPTSEISSDVSQFSTAPSTGTLLVTFSPNPSFVPFQFNGPQPESEYFAYPDFMTSSVVSTFSSTPTSAPTLQLSSFMPCQLYETTEEYVLEPLLTTPPLSSTSSFSISSYETAETCFKAVETPTPTICDPTGSCGRDANILGATDTMPSGLIHNVPPIWDTNYLGCANVQPVCDSGLENNVIRLEYEENERLLMCQLTDNETPMIGPLEMEYMQHLSPSNPLAFALDLPVVRELLHVPSPPPPTPGRVPLYKRTSKLNH
ncbi:unnamed protein product [Caenorhabditis sp. 36 PRJEB53466]|nr:unnamed protein product [Caenorhabditis sp. 36 PRJEB53466]